MITEKDFEYIDRDEMTEIRITADNAWHDVQLRFGNVSARVIEDSERAELTFDLSVTNQDADVTEEIENDPDFQQYVGGILTYIISNAFENEEYRIGGDEHTDNDPKEPTAQ